MPGWALVNTHPTQGRTFQRPLSTLEHGYFLDGLFNGTVDIIQHYELRLLNGSQDAHLFSETNIARAWVSTKRRHPLAGAIVERQEQGIGAAAGSKTEGSGGGDDDMAGIATKLNFVVRERELSLLRPHEIVFGQVTCAEEAQQRAVAIMDGPRPLSKDLLIRLYIFRETDSQMARADIIHLMISVAHCITDFTANKMFLRCFLDTLARGSEPDAEPAQMPLEDRLAMVVSMEELEPIHLRTLSPARQRWRKAAAAIIFDLRMARDKGGHTLPWRLTRSTSYTPARSGFVDTLLTHAQSADVFANCQLHHITFGNAFRPLGQVAMTRVLYRRYLRGEISEEEWAYRKRQPHISRGAVDLRPYLDNAWFKGGGGGEFVTSLGFYTNRLPVMTLGDEQRPEQHEGVTEGVLEVPRFSDLLTFDRFLHRSRLVKKQMTAFLRHPLFFEIMNTGHRRFIVHQRHDALEWMKRIKGGNHDIENENEHKILAITEAPVVQAHMGSTLGNVDLVLPLEYPLPPTHALSPFCPVSHPMKAGYIVPPSPSPPLATGADTTPKIAIEYSRARLCTHPGELYLSAVTSRGQLNMCVFYDSNAFEEEIVAEWLDEVKEAVLWYLGSSVTRCGDGKTGLDQEMRAKL